MQAAEDAWNTRDPARVATAYTPDSHNDRRIDESERRITGPRPESERGLDIPIW
ncbi:DUF1348 family protein [Actinoplanes auranticolor]|uniref:Uncharacterized protein n=1 Tax=Actinoplanes auranticolor TaxID=47988 RepID=A0A919SJP2_9ACTN|nr:DUF1348 family protein [Actinoplanes auranticolor]GIM74010.1 hypothetical protein Aau02nite_58730 [Actinoplanes auranticolor]